MHSHPYPLVDRSLIPSAYVVSLPDMGLCLIGALCVVWSQFEFLVDFTSFHLKGLTFDQGRTSEKNRDITRRLTALEAIAGSTLPPEQEAILRDICQRGQITAQKRNLAVHGNWTERPNESRHAAVSWFKVPPGTPLKVLADEELAPLVIDAALLGLDLRRFLELRGVLPTP